MGQWCFFSKYILKRKQVLLAFYMEMVSSSSSKGSKWQFSMANWSSIDWGGFQVLDSLCSSESLQRTPQVLRESHSSVHGVNSTLQPYLQSSSPGPQGLQKSSNTVYIRLQIESHSLPVFEALGPHVKIQPSSTPELDAVTEGLEHDFDSVAEKPEAHECPRTTALAPVGWG